MSFWYGYFNKIKLLGIKGFQGTKELSIFSLSSVLYNSLFTLIGIGILYYLSPFEIGVWNSLLIAQPYLFIFQLGVFTGLNRELPFLFGSDQKALALDLVAIAWRFSVLLSVMSIAIAIVAFYYLFNTNNPSIVYIGSIGVGIQVSCEFLTNFLLVLYRTKENLLKLSIVYFIQCFFLVISIPLITAFGYFGFVLRASLLAVTMTVLLFIYRPFDLVRNTRNSLILHLIRIGLPLFTFGYLQGITKSFSRIILLIFGNTVMVGLYAPSAAVIVGIGMIPSALSQYFYPRMSFLLGKHGRAELLWPKVWRYSLLSILICIPLIILGWVLIPIIIQMYLPAYNEGILPAQISLISGTLEAATVGLNVLNSMKAHAWLFLLTLLKLALFFICQYFLAQFFNPVLGIALGYFLASLLYLVAGMIIVYMATHSEKYTTEQSLN